MKGSDKLLTYKRIWLNGLQVLGDNCPYTSNLYNFLYDSSNTNNDSELMIDGNHSGTSKINAKTFTMILDTITANGIKAKDDIKKKLQVTYIISKGLIPIIVEIDGLGKVIVNAKKESIVTDDNGIMTITFSQPDPYVYCYEYKEIVLEKKIEGGFTLPPTFTLPSSWTLNAKEVGNIGEIINEGYVTTYPEITIEGEGFDFKVFNLTTGEQLNINTSLEYGQKMFINCHPKHIKVYKDDESIINYKTGNYISLVHGSNEIKVEYEGTATVSIRFREAYI